MYYSLSLSLSLQLTNDTLSDQLQSNLPLYSYNSKVIKMHSTYMYVYKYRKIIRVYLMYCSLLCALCIFFALLQFGKGRDLLLSSHDSRAASTKPHSRERLPSSVSQPSTDHLIVEEDCLTAVDELQSSKELDSYREKIMLVCNTTTPTVLIMIGTRKFFSL